MTCLKTKKNIPVFVKTIEVTRSAVNLQNFLVLALVNL